MHTARFKENFQCHRYLEFSLENDWEGRWPPMGNHTSIFNGRPTEIFTSSAAVILVEKETNGRAFPFSL